MDLSICIVTHCQPALLPLCVRSCFEEIERARIRGEVLVVDNASAGQYPDTLAATYPSVRIIRNERNLGFAQANNLAIRASLGQYILLLNDDAILTPGSLGLLLCPLKSDPRIGAVGPKLVNPDGSPQIGVMLGRSPHVRGTLIAMVPGNGILVRNGWTRRLLTISRNPELGGDTEQVMGACLLARREALFDVGLLDENFYYYFEDADVCYRMRKRGWRLFYVPEAAVTHYGSASAITWSRSTFFRTYISSTLYYFEKNAKRWQFLALRILLLPLVFCRMSFLFCRGLIRKERRSHKDWTETLRSHALVLKWLVFGAPGVATERGTAAIREL